MRYLLLFLFLLGCGDVGSSSIESNQQQGIGALPSQCQGGCELVGCAEDGSIRFQFTCQGFSGGEIGVAPTIGDLPAQCLGEALPDCAEESAEEES
jgi:hypothetical protein